jgi:CheY-like chemotaxis protein
MQATNVLLVEDNRLLRWWMTTSLQEEGYSVVPSHSAEEAFRLAASAAFDILITDWRLSEGRTGLEVLACVRQKSPRTLAVLISAETDTPGQGSGNGADGTPNHGAATLAERARAFGFDLVIQKPFPVAEIVGAVHNLSTTLRQEVVP